MKRFSSIREVAAHAGYSKSTVSLALKGDPSIPRATAEKIWSAAQDLNYRVNPMVASLMATLRARRSDQAGTVIAYLTASASPTGWMANRTFERYHVGAQTRARELGYIMEHFWLREPGMSNERFNQIFAARGIRGIVVGPVPVDIPVRLDWQRLALVRIGFSLREDRMHTVANHQLRTMGKLLQKLKILGLRRIGIVVPTEDDIRVENNWSAGRLLHERDTAPTDLVQPFTSRPNAESVLAWVRENRPDAVVTTRTEVLGWLREAGIRVPGDIAFALLDAEPGGDISGMDQRSEAIGAAAIDLVVEQLTNNDRGIPPHPKTVLTEGDWFAGRTTPATDRSTRSRYSS